MKYFLIGLLLLISIVFYYEMSYVEFKPKIFKNDSYLIVVVDQSFYERLKKVLDYYDVDYKFIDHKVYVRRISIREDELVYNYYTKAMDQNWLNSH